MFCLECSLTKTPRDPKKKTELLECLSKILRNNCWNKKCEKCVTKYEKIYTFIDISHGHIIYLYNRYKLV